MSIRKLITVNAIAGTIAFRKYLFISITICLS